MLQRFTYVLSLTSLLLGDACSGSPTKRQATLDTFISQESPIARAGILANIGDQGGKVFGAGPGLVIASPSTSDPDYFFSWTRDAALTLKALVDMFVGGESNLQSTIENYVNAQVDLQNTCNPAGCLSTGGLAEAKFNRDRSAFTGGWGRPQRDGPALRVTAMVPYARWLVANGRKQDAINVVWPLMQNDLSYVAENWNQTGFDLWEEIKGSSFFTTAVQYRALVEGNALAGELGKTCSGCAQVSPQILCFLQRYWTGSYIDSNINVDDGRKGLDVNSVLASIHIFDPSARCDDSTFQPCSSRMLANHKALSDSFRSVYSINSGIKAGQAVSIGRYSEDVYYGGNPWYLSTLAAAEQLYAALYQWNKIGSITIDSTSLHFWQDLYSSATVGTYASSSATYKALTSAVRSYADGYFAIVQKYTPSNGGLAEQFSKTNGSPLSAVDLTWSYAAFLTAAQRRASIVPPSWGGISASTAPTVCSATTIRGTYTAPSAKFSTTTPPCSTQVQVTFKEKVQTNVGQDIYLVGSIPALGSWDTSKAILLSASQYTSDNNIWFVRINLPINTNFQYKYFKKMSDGSNQWESDPDRQFTVPNGCNGNIAATNDSWR